MKENRRTINEPPHCRRPIEPGGYLEGFEDFEDFEQLDSLEP